MESRNKAEKLGEQIFDAVIKEHNRLGLVTVNRGISFDFAKIFKETSMDYAGNCILVERLFLRNQCETMKKPVQKLPPEAVDIRNEILQIACDVTKTEMSDQDKIEQLKKAEKLEEQLREFKLIDAEVELLAYSPIPGDDNSFVVMDIGSDDFSKIQYKSFCSQMAYFAFNYFAAMIMVPPLGIELEVEVVRGTSFIDILCKIVG